MEEETFREDIFTKIPIWWKLESVKVTFLLSIFRRGKVYLWRYWFKINFKCRSLRIKYCTSFEEMGCMFHLLLFFLKEVEIVKILTSKNVIHFPFIVSYQRTIQVKVAKWFGRAMKGVRSGIEKFSNWLYEKWQIGGGHIVVKVTDWGS